MKTYQNFNVDVHNCDVNGNLRVSVLLKLMQETSTKQLENSLISQKKLMEAGKTYVLSRLNISIYRQAQAGDTIEVSTWPCESRGLSLTRCYQARIDGNIIAEAITVWGVIDITTRQLFRVSNLPVDIECEEPLELDFPTRIHIPNDMSLGLVGERTVVYSDLDINGHMNNTNYPDMICDFIPEMENKRVLMMGISYISEARGGTPLKVYLGKGDGQYYIRTVGSDGETNCEAVVMLEEIPIYERIK